MSTLLAYVALYRSFVQSHMWIGLVLSGLLVVLFVLQIFPTFLANGTLCDRRIAWKTFTVLSFVGFVWFILPWAMDSWMLIAMMVLLVYFAKVVGEIVVDLFKYLAGNIIHKKE